MSQVQLRQVGQGVQVADEADEVVVEVELAQVDVLGETLDFFDFIERKD